MKINLHLSKIILIFAYRNDKTKRTMTKIYTLSNGTTIKVHLQKKGESNSFFGNSNSWHDVYRLIMDFGNGKKFTTTFHNSVHDYGKNITESTIDNAIDCVISDFMAYDNYPYASDFLNEFGYDCYKDKNAGMRAYNGCCSIYERLSELMTENDIVELYKIVRNED